MLAKIALCATALLLSPPTTDGQPKTPTVATPNATAESQPSESQPSESQPSESQPSESQPAVKTEEEQGVDHQETDLRAIEQNIIKLTNAERTRRGLPALKLDMSLMKTARHHASWMARSRKMIHSRLNLGENIAMGQPTSTSALHAWMNSSGHRANILNRSYKRIGAAAYRTPSGTIYWCQQFRF